MDYKYSVKENWGKTSSDQFIRHEDRMQFHIEGFPGNVWVTEDNVYGRRWISRHSAVAKTKSQISLMQLKILGTITMLKAKHQLKKLQDLDLNQQT